MQTDLSFDKRRSSSSGVSLQNILWVVLGFFAAQRFTLSDLAGLICLFPFALALVRFRSNIPQRNSLLLLALFWSIDSVVPGSSGTPSVVRYLIYATVILALTENTLVRRSGLLGTLFAALFYLTITLVNSNENLSGLQMQRDVQILILCGIIFSLKTKHAFTLDLKLLLFATTGFLVSEGVNYIALSSLWYGEYMSYDSTKYLIAFPSLFLLLAGRLHFALALIAITILALVGYTHRTLFLAYFAAILAIILFFSMRNGLTKRVLIISGVVLAVFMLGGLDLRSLFESSKALNMFLLVQRHGYQVLEILDPVRYTSSLIFFKLPLFDLLFGRGFGSGVLDVGNLFGFVRADQTAFTVQELNSGYFYNFHDVWVDVGLRFGLLPFVIFLIWLIRMRPVGSKEGMVIWILVFMGIASAFFSSAGLLSIFFLIRVLQSYQSTHA